MFNYGTFRFDSPWLILDFLKGKLSSWLSVSSLERYLQCPFRFFSERVLNLEEDPEDEGLEGQQVARVVIDGSSGAE